MSAREGERAALMALERVTGQGAYFGQALSQALQALHVQGPGRAAASAYARTAVENLRAIDFALSQFTDLRKCGHVVRNILRLGAGRMLFSDAPDAVVVNASVELARSSNKRAQAKYVNAVLRNLARSKEEIPWPQDDPVQRLAIRYSWPDLAVEEALSLLGEAGAEAFCSYRGNPYVSLRVNAQKRDRSSAMALLQQSGITCEASPYHPYGVRAYGVENPAGLPMLRRGEISLQGEASMLAARQLEGVRGHILDLCAAPGGKSMALAEAPGQRSIHAFDIHPHRVALIQAQIKRLGLAHVEAQVHDATQPLPHWKDRADGVLVDAPCSGLGTALHRPDVKCNRTLEDVAALSRVQAQILAQAGQLVRPGGVLLYCTCTFLRAENAEIVQAFLQAHPTFALAPLTLPDALCSQVHNGMLQLWPQVNGTDAFFMAKLVRR